MFNTLRTQLILPWNEILGLWTKEIWPCRQRVTRNWLVFEDLNCSWINTSFTWNWTRTNVTDVDSEVWYMKTCWSCNWTTSNINYPDTTAIRLVWNYTICFSLKRNNNTNTQRIINKDNANDFSWWYWIYLATKFQWPFNIAWTHSNWSNQNWDTTYTPPVWEWVNIICEFNWTTRFLYINWDLFGSFATTWNVTWEATNNMLISAYWATTALWQYLDWFIGLVRMYNRTLSPTEKLTIYKEHQKLLH